MGILIKISYWIWIGFNSKIMNISQLSTKLTIITFLIILAPALMTSIYAVQMSKETLQELALTTQTAHAKVLKQYIESFLEEVAGDMLLVSESMPLKLFLQSQQVESELGDLEQLRHNFAKELLRLAQIRKTYYQIRYLDKTGQEIVKISSEDLTHYSLVWQTSQIQSDYPYFTQTAKLSGQTLFISPILFSPVNSTGSEKTHQPMLYYAMNVGENSQPEGMVVLDVAISGFLKLLGEARLVDQEGYFLHHPEESKLRGKDLETSYHFSGEYPYLAKQILGESGVYKTQELILSHQKIKLPDLNVWTLMIQNDTQEISENVTRFYVILMVILVSAVLISLVFAVIVKRP